MAVRKGWFIVGCIAVALIGAGYWGVQSVSRNAARDRILKDPFSDHPIKYEELGPSHYFRFSYRATFDGQPIELDQLVECRPVLASGGIGGGTYLQYQKIPERSGIRLPDGGVVYFPLPNFCRFNPSSRQWQEYWRPDNPVEAVPQTFWANRIENPDVIEAYIALDYFSHPQARLQIRESRVTFLPRSYQPERKPAVDPQLQRLGGRGWALLPMASEQGGQAPSIAESAAGILAAFPLGEQAWQTTNRPLTTYLAAIRSIPLGLPGSLLMTHEEGWVQQGRSLAARSIPLLWDGATYTVVSAAPPGLIYLYPDADVYVQLSRQDPSLVSGGERIVLPTSQTAFPGIELCDRRLGACYSIHLWSE